MTRFAALLRKFFPLIQVVFTIIWLSNLASTEAYFSVYAVIAFLSFFLILKGRHSEGEKADLFSLVLSVIFSVAVLCCSLICLFVKLNAGYWCAWAVASPLLSFSTYIVGLNFLFRLKLALILFYAVMFFIARKIFNMDIIKSGKKTKLLILSWVVFVGVIFGLYSISTLGGTDILINLFSHAGMALLVTYTACYTKK